MAFNSNFVDLQNIVIDSNDPYYIELKKYIDSNKSLDANRSIDDNISEHLSDKNYILGIGNENALVNFLPNKIIFIINLIEKICKFLG